MTSRRRLTPAVWHKQANTEINTGVSPDIIPCYAGIHTPGIDCHRAGRAHIVLTTVTLQWLSDTYCHVIPQRGGTLTHTLHSLINIINLNYTGASVIDIHQIQCYVLCVVWLCVRVQTPVDWYSAILMARDQWYIINNINLGSVNYQTSSVSTTHPALYRNTERWYTLYTQHRDIDIYPSIDIHAYMYVLSYTVYT